VNGVYWCACGGWANSPSEQCGPKVGYSDIATEHHRKCRYGSPDWECWKDATAIKTGGAWYSTDSVGYCGDGSSPAPPGCTWSVKEVVKVVNKSCSDDAIFTAVETAALSVRRDTTGGGCFEECSDSGVGANRNTTSPCAPSPSPAHPSRPLTLSPFHLLSLAHTSPPCARTPPPSTPPASDPLHPTTPLPTPVLCACAAWTALGWINCFYAAALGPDAGTPGGTVAGLPLQTLLDAWNRPFLPTAQGGCPPLADEIRSAPPRTRKWRGFPGWSS
jgi:hypothetical protein